MRILYVATAALVLLAPSAPAQEAYCDHLNSIGIYDTTEPTGDPDETYIYFPSGVGGGFTTYLVICNPTDETTSLPISNLGGYELAIILPDGWIPNITYPEGTILVSPGLPDISVVGTIPVTGTYTVLAEIAIGTWAGDGASGGIYLTPIDDSLATIPGQMVITDSDNDGAL